MSFYRLSTPPLRKSRKKVGTFFMKKKEKNRKIIGISNKK